jgi:hypothetical protein
MHGRLRTCGKMMNDERTLEVSKKRASDWTIKDALIAVPFFASGLALTWEVGFFQVRRGGSFGIFIIAEHITFALQALPVAFILSIAIVGLMAEHYRIPRVVSIDMPHNARRWLARGLLVFSLIMIILMGVIFYHAGRSATFLLPLAIIGNFTLVFMLTPELIKSRTVRVIFGLTIGFVMAFGFGIDIARFELWSELPLNKITIGEKGKDAETEVAARIIRSGERGVLYFDPKLERFSVDVNRNNKGVPRGAQIRFGLL